MATPLPADVVAFLLQTGGSLHALELLLLLRRTRAPSWSSDDIAQVLGLSESIVDATLADLRSKRVLLPEDPELGIDQQPVPISGDLAERVDRPALTEEGQRLKLMGLLCSAAMEHVREIADILQRALRVADVNELAFDDPLVEQAALGDGFLERAARQGVKLVDFERAYLHAVLRVVGGNKSEAARRLGMNRRTLQRRLGGEDELDDDDDDDDDDSDDDDDAEDARS